MSSTRMMSSPSALFLWASLALLTASPASSLPTQRKDADKQGGVPWTNSFDKTFQKSELKSGYSKASPFKEVASPDRSLSKDEEISTTSYVVAAFRNQRPETNKEFVDETYYTTETEFESTTSPGMEEFTTQQEVQHATESLTEIMHAMPVINPPIWMQETSPDHVFEPINERFDTYDRYSQSIGHGVFRMRTRIF